jgi:hypothetical protein
MTTKTTAAEKAPAVVAPAEEDEVEKGKEEKEVEEEVGVEKEVEEEEVGAEKDELEEVGAEDDVGDVDSTKKWMIEALDRTII